MWEVATELRAQKPIEIVCGYRAPATNEMLRKRGSGVAKASMHTHGQAMDFYIPDVPLEQLRYAGLRLQRGGVGFYPTSGSPFVHLDTGKVRHWPDISRQELARVFPNGRTVHVPSDGRPMSGYALALADVEKRGSSPSQSSLDAAQGAGIAVASNAKNSSASGGKDDEEDDAANTPSRATAAKPATTTYRTAEAVPAEPAPLRLASVPLPRKRPPIPAQTVAQAGSPAKNAGSSGPWDRGQSLAQVDSAAGRRQVRRSIDRRERFRRGVGLCTGVSSHRACIGRRGCDCRIDRRENLSAEPRATDAATGRDPDIRGRARGSVG